MTDPDTRTHQTVTSLLHEQHEHVKEMFEELSRAQDGTRRELFDCLRATLAVHETAEEIVVHPTARRAGPRAAAVVDARLEEEAEAKRTLADLEKLGIDGEGFDVKLSGFQQAVIRHAGAEERELFPILETTCDHDDLTSMAKRLRDAEKLAPTHAHPHGPTGPTLNLLTGPFVAMADKVRDHLAR